MSAHLRYGVFSDWLGLGLLSQYCCIIWVRIPVSWWRNQLHHSYNHMMSVYFPTALRLGLLGMLNQHESTLFCQLESAWWRNQLINHTMSVHLRYGVFSDWLGLGLLSQYCCIIWVRIAVSWWRNQLHHSYNHMMPVYFPTALLLGYGCWISMSEHYFVSLSQRDDVIN